MEAKLINIVPEGVEEVFHLSQNDNGRVIRCNLTETLAGSEALVLRYKKANGDYGAIPVENDGGTYTDISIPSAITDAPGFVYCKLRINSIGAKAFFINVERKP